MRQPDTARSARIRAERFRAIPEIDSDRPLAVRSGRIRGVRNPSRRRAATVLCALGSMIAASLVHGASYTSTVEFVATDQSIWGIGTDDLPITNANPPATFYGIGDDVWNFGDPTPPSSGLYFGGHTKGKIGLDVDFSFDSGTVDAIVPYTAGLQFTYAQFNASGPATIQTEAFLQDHAFLQTRSPDLRFGADLVFSASAGIYGGGCVDAWLVSGCASFNEGFSIPEIRTELIAMNRGGDGEFRLVPDVQDYLEFQADRAETLRRLEEGDKEANEKNPDGTTKNTRQRTTARLKHLVDLGVGLPDLVTADVVLPELGTSGGIDGDVLRTARAEDNIVNLEIDVDGLATALGIIPPLEVDGSLDAGLIAQGSFNANLADVTLQPSFTLAQQFTLDPVLEMDLILSREMEVTVNGTTMTTDRINGLVAGVDAFLLQWDDGTPLFVTPVYRLSSAAFLNDLDLGLDLDLNLKLLSASAQLEILGIDLPRFQLGPLVDETFNLEGILAPGEDGFGFLDIEDWAFQLEALMALEFTGDVITMFPVDATFIGAGIGSSWSNPDNWDSGAIGDDGNMVEIVDGATAAVTASDGGADNIVEVGELAIGEGATVTNLGRSRDAGHRCDGVRERGPVGGSQHGDARGRCAVQRRRQRRNRVRCQHDQRSVRSERADVHAGRPDVRRFHEYDRRCGEHVRRRPRQRRRSIRRDVPERAARSRDTKRRRHHDERRLGGPGVELGEPFITLRYRQHRRPHRGGQRELNRPLTRQPVRAVPGHGRRYRQNHRRHAVDGRDVDDLDTEPPRSRYGRE